MKTLQRTLVATTLIGLSGAAMQAHAYGNAVRGGCQPGYGPQPYYGPYGPVMPPAYAAPGMHPPMRPMPYAQPYRQPMARQQPMAQQPAEPSESASVTIRQMQFIPARVVVRKGGTVTWNQVDTMPHTVTARDGSFGSQQLGASQSFSQLFDTPGTYSYYCSIHPSMQAVVEVVE
ncbi:MAG: plastocyanin/azurin family copper-binding protein [Gammaproteobacteria bacterium]